MMAPMLRYRLVASLSFARCATPIRRSRLREAEAASLRRSKVAPPSPRGGRSKMCAFDRGFRRDEENRVRSDFAWTVFNDSEHSHARRLPQRCNSHADIFHLTAWPTIAIAMCSGFITPACAESDIASAIIQTGEHLGYLHTGDSHRGYMGSGTIDLTSVFRARWSTPAIRDRSLSNPSHRASWDSRLRAYWASGGICGTMAMTSHHTH